MMNEDRMGDLLFEVLGGEVTIRDNQTDFDDWKYLIDNDLVEASKPEGSAGSRIKTIILRRLTEAGKKKLVSIEGR